jgi:hypothetical protein
MIEHDWVSINPKETCNPDNLDKWNIDLLNWFLCSNCKLLKGIWINRSYKTIYFDEFFGRPEELETVDYIKNCSEQIIKKIL